MILVYYKWGQGHPATERPITHTVILNLFQDLLKQDETLDMITEINYDKLIEKSLKNVVVEALKIARDSGLPGQHHYYITFKTKHPQNSISPRLIANFPAEMTIVLQHQFSNLLIEPESFSIDLSFSGIKETLKIAYDAITNFADPHAKFALNFSVAEHVAPKAAEPKKEEKKAEPVAASVISIDSFRKKKK